MIARLAIVAAVCLCATSASALTMKECSAKYKAAQAAGNTLKWADFRKAECAADAAATPAAAPAAGPAAAPAAAPAPAPAAPPPTEAAKPPAPKKVKAAAKPAEAPNPAAVPTGDAVFPKAVDPKYAKETAGDQRKHTCLDQYKANKANNGNGGLTWTVKGGGYYHECTKRLKGES